MAFSKLALLAAGAASVSALVASPMAGGKHLTARTIDLDSQCSLPPSLDPSNDGLPHSSKLFGSKDALMKQVKRHSAIVRVPSVCYDDLGKIGEDKRWKPFDKLHEVLKETYPLVHKHAKLEKINTYGLLYTIEGTDPSLKPTVLMAHQDVVPVADESTWTHPPFSGHFDGELLWGRGSSDDKNSLTALMSTVETMLQDPDWKPRRTLLLSFGFDEECSGYRGAKEIAAVLTKRYGDDGIAVILDEGGMGVQDIDDVTYILPSVMEKGHVDIWFELHVVGGHSSIPFPHTGIGIISEIVTKLEANPYKPALTKENPVYSHMACMARYSPKENPKITELVRQDDLQGIADELASMGLLSNFLVQTSQAVDFIAGGQKINAMPEVTTLGVNYRVAPQESIVDVQHNVVNHIQEIVDKYGIKVKAFEGDEEYHAHAANAGSKKAKTSVEPDYDVDWKGTLKLEAREVTQVAPVSPMEGSAWNIFSGTAQYTFETGKNTVVPTGETMTGNTDTRHYLNLTRNVYRFTPMGKNSSNGVHTIDEYISMKSHMKVIEFYYNFIRNFDAADLNQSSKDDFFGEL